jgi:hypothetical protein
MIARVFLSLAESWGIRESLRGVYNCIESCSVIGHQGINAGCIIFLRSFDES